MGSPQTNVVCHSSSTSCGNGPELVSPACSVIDWEHPPGSGLVVNVAVGTEGEHLGPSINYVHETGTRSCAFLWPQFVGLTLSYIRFSYLHELFIIFHWCIYFILHCTIIYCTIRYYLFIYSSSSKLPQTNYRFLGLVTNFKMFYLKKNLLGILTGIALNFKLIWKRTGSYNYYHFFQVYGISLYSFVFFNRV